MHAIAQTLTSAPATSLTYVKKYQVPLLLMKLFVWCIGTKKIKEKSASLIVIVLLKRKIFVRSEY